MQTKKPIKGMENNFIGIDPDVTKSGVAFYEAISGKLEMSNLAFFALYDYLVFAKNEKQGHQSIKVIIEAGWLNKSNWHAAKNGSAAINAQIGQRTGANHETGKKIVEMCEYLDIEFELIKPTKSKLDSKTFNAITGTIGRTNQEQRDAAMIVFGRKYR